VTAGFCCGSSAATASTSGLSVRRIKLHERSPSLGLTLDHENRTDGLSFYRYTTVLQAVRKCCVSVIDGAINLEPVLGKLKEIFRASRSQPVG
jgi:hypothetical protein